MEKKGYAIFNPPSESRCLGRDDLDENYGFSGDRDVSKSAKRNSLEKDLVLGIRTFANEFPRGYRIKISVEKIWRD